MRSRVREKERRRRREHEEKTEGRVVIRIDSFACDDHCSVRSMKTHEQSKRSHLTPPSGRSSHTSSSHRPISADRVLQTPFQGYGTSKWFCRSLHRGYN